MVFPVKGKGTFPALLLLHGFPGGESDVFGIGEKLQKSGCTVLTFNYSGTYQSDGEYSMEHSQRDIEAALKFLTAHKNTKKYQIDPSQIYLGGYSFGGGMSLTYAANHPKIKKVFSIAGTDHGEFFREYFKDGAFTKMIDEMFEQLKEPDGPVRFEEGKMPKDVTPEQVKHSLDSTIDLRVCAPLIADRKILLIAGLDDQWVTLENHLLPLYRALQVEGAEHVKFVLLQDDHSFKRTREEVCEIVTNWIMD